MSKFRWLLTILFIFLECNALQAQLKEEYKCYYTVGEPCPDFTFDHVVNYSKKSVTLNNFRGKWLILDFWHTGCSSCIKSFPKVNREQEQFKENVQFLLIGYQDEKGDINRMFDRLTNKMHLKIPCAFDSVLKSKVQELVHGMPFNVIIDPEGIVRGSMPLLNDSILLALTLTARPTLQDFWREAFNRIKYNSKKPFLVDGNGGNDGNFLFRNLLSKCDQSSARTEFPDSINADGGNFTALNRTIADLYMYAYADIKLNRPPGPLSPLYGKIWPVIIWELKDSSKNEKIIKEDKYSYSLNIPPEKATKKFMTRIMQQDLYNYFGFSAKIEVRKMPCWKLVVKQSALENLRTKDTSVGIKESPVMEQGDNLWQVLDVTNIDMKTVITALAFAANIEQNDGPIIDESGIDFNIDIHLHFIPFDLSSVKGAMNKSGFDLVKSTKEIEVLVIREGKQNYQ